MQEVVDATLSKKVETSIISIKSLQVLRVSTEHDSVLEAVLKGACGNTSLKYLSMMRCSDHLKTVADELRQARPQLEFDALSL